MTSATVVDLAVLSPVEVHIAGVCSQRRLLEHGLREIPNTGGHRGYGVPLRDLRPFSDLVERAAPSVFAKDAA